MHVLEHLPSLQNSNSQLRCCRLVPSVPSDHWCWMLHKWEMITGVVAFNPPQGVGWGEWRVEEVEGRGKRMEPVPVGEVWCCFYRASVCVWRTLPRVKPPRDPTVISVMDTNMFIVLLCPTGGKDPVIIIWGVVLSLYILCCVYSLWGLQRDDVLKCMILLRIFGVQWLILYS